VPRPVLSGRVLFNSGSGPFPGVSVAGLVEYAAALSNACGHEVNIHRNARPDKPALSLPNGTGRGTRRIERQRREPERLGFESLGQRPRSAGTPAQPPNQPLKGRDKSVTGVATISGNRLRRCGWCSGPLAGLCPAGVQTRPFRPGIASWRALTSFSFPSPRAASAARGEGKGKQRGASFLPPGVKPPAYTPAGQSPPRRALETPGTSAHFCCQKNLPHPRFPA